MPGTYPTQLAVSCDRSGCGHVLSGDFLVAEDDDRDTRLGYVLDHAAREGWTVVGREDAARALTFCPAHPTSNGAQRDRA